MTDRSAKIEVLGNALFEATESRKPIAPIREQLEDTTLNDAYAIQTVQLNRHLAAGRKLAGHKIGLTSFAMQKQLGVDSPDFGFFLNNMVYEAGATVPTNGFIAPKVEPELAFKLSKDLTGPDVTVADVLEATEAVYPAIEIIDSRVEEWNIKLVDTVADNASCGAIVLGAEPIAVPFEKLTEVPCTLRINGKEKDSGTGRDVMGHPAEPLAWLANVLSEQGVSLKAGQFVLTGSFTGALPVVSGEKVTADYGDLGSLEITFG